MWRGLILGIAAGLLGACSGSGDLAPFAESRTPASLAERFYPPEGWAWGFVRIGEAPDQRYGVAAPNGVPRAEILILPDYGETAETWFETVRDLNHRGFAVWVLEGAGQGGSGVPWARATSAMCTVLRTRHRGGRGDGLRRHPGPAGGALDHSGPRRGRARRRADGARRTRRRRLGPRLPKAHAATSRPGHAIPGSGPPAPAGRRRMAPRHARRLCAQGRDPRPVARRRDTGLADGQSGSAHGRPQPSMAGGVRRRRRGGPRGPQAAERARPGGRGRSGVWLPEPQALFGDPPGRRWRGAGARARSGAWRLARCHRYLRPRRLAEDPKP